MLYQLLYAKYLNYSCHAITDIILKYSKNVQNRVFNYNEKASVSKFDFKKSQIIYYPFS